MRICLTLPILFGSLIVPASFSQDAQREPNQRPQQSPFQALFSIRGIEFSEDQQAAVAELREEFIPQLTEFQQRRNAVYTAEQRRARREAFLAAQEAGKNGQEARVAGDAAAGLSDEQQEKLSEIQQEQVELLAEIQTELRDLLTDRQQAQLRRSQQPQTNQRRTAPTHADLKYGPSDRNVMDVWLANADEPTPVLVSIHGGGFRAGNKGIDARLLRQCLEAGISVVAITYRLSGEAIAPAQFLDSARAIQFIRHNADDWNLDSGRIASTGGSAGAGISLWLGFHDDLADPDNEDPVLRQSTRLTCMAVYNGQTSYDPRFIRDLFPDNDTYQHSALAQLYDVNLSQLDDLPEEKYRLFEEVSALPHLNAGDAPALLMYASEMETPITNQSIGIHHPRFGEALKKEMDELDIECQVETSVQRGDESFVDLTMAFVRKYLEADASP